MPFRIKPWHCVALFMLLLIAVAVNFVQDRKVIFDGYTVFMWMYEAEYDKVMQELNALNNEFYATLSPADRASIREGLSDTAREWYPMLFDDVTPAQPTDPTWSDRHRKARRKLDKLIKRFELLNSVPVSP